ncbi:hypothetical protein B2J73_15960, partial [Stutzerimonas stutzeri]
ARLQLKVGKELDVLIDEVDEDGAIGRSWADAPERGPALARRAPASLPAAADWPAAWRWSD